MRRFALAAAFAVALVGCGGGLTEEPWSGDPDPFEADDTLETAKELPLHARPQRHTFSPDGDVDWIRFRVTEADLYGGYDPETSATYQTGAFYRFYPMAPVGSVHLTLYDHEQAYVFDRYNAMERCFAVPGIYYLEVEENAGEGGEYSMLILSGTSPDLNRPADLAVATVELPATVDVDSTHTVEVRVSNCGNVASNKYTLVPYVSADRVLDAGDCKILGTTDPLTEVPDLYYNRIVTMDVTFTADGGTLPPPGPVYVLIKAVLSGEVDTSDNVAVGSTLLGLYPVDEGDSEDPNDDVASASDATLTDPIVPDLAFWPAGDPDYFKLQHAAAGQWHEVWTDSLRGGADTMIEIVDGTAMPIFNDFDGSVAVDEDSGPENNASYLRFRLDGSPAVYFIRVTDVNGATGGYDLHVRSLPSGATPDTCEPNEDRRTWRVLKRDVPLEQLPTLSFSSDADQDWFAYSVAASDGTYDGVSESWGAPWATHTFTTLSVTGCDTDLIVLDSKGVLVPGAINNEEGANTSAIVAVELPAGLYYVGVTCKALSAGGTYKLSAVVTPP